MGSAIRFQQILGIRFMVANTQVAIDQILSDGGLLVVPSAPVLKNMASDNRCREAVLAADFAIADSGLMVLLWNILQLDNVSKLSGLKYLRSLVRHTEFRVPGASFWVMPSHDSARRNLAWLSENGIEVADRDFYVAPLYDEAIADPELLRRLEERRPRNVVICLGGGTQEPLGLYLKQNLSYKPAIHCIGAAIAFLSGDQVRIPVMVDEFGLGWLWRTMSHPRRYGPRYWEARSLVPLLIRYRDRLPSFDSPTLVA
ncbi:MAG: WecB/TagA/CpsF family glycosyltransferase [Terracidiphilus sp.]|jgi:UDP-N-acetyl-D-mannosaminuronic acid transferase (WecB/TagA/CpsF family)